MVNLIRKYGLYFTAVLLSVVICGYVILGNVNKNGVATEIRTVTMERNVEYLKYFDEYEIVEKENSAEFLGTLPFDEKLLTSFDNVSLNDVDDYKDCDININCTFDTDKMQFTLRMALVDVDGNVIDEENTVTDAFVTENGRLDAYIEIGDETYLLSECRAKLVNAVDDCGFFDWLLVPFMPAIVIVYAVTSESAEQIRAKSNYEYNKELEAAGNGVNYGNYITDQSEHSRTGYNSANYRFGFTTFDGVGCEVASVYNLLISLNKTEMLSETIHNFEVWAIELSIGWGNLGSNPNEIYRYLDKKGIGYKKYTSYSSFKSALEQRGSCKFIMSTWNKGGVTSGLHTYYCFKTSDTEIRSYNMRSRTTYETHTNIDDVYSYGGNFIVAYIIN